MQRKSFNWQLPPEIEARLGEATYGRQRTIHEAGHLLIILHSPPDPETHKREVQVFLRKPDGSLSWNGMGNGQAQLRLLLASYRKLFEKYEDEHDEAESATDLLEILKGLGPLNRASSHLEDTLQSARELVKEDKFLIAMRDEAYEISRSFDLLLAEAKLALDYRIAKSAEAQGRKATELAAAQHKLNIIAAVTFPLIAVGTLFGMNLIHGLEGMPVFFWLIAIVGGGAGMLTLQWVTNRYPRHDRGQPY